MSATQQDIQNLQANMINMGNNLQANQTNNFNNLQNNQNGLQKEINKNSDTLKAHDIAVTKNTTNINNAQDDIALTQLIQKWTYSIDKVIARVSQDPEANDYIPLGTMFDFDPGEWLNSIITPETKFKGPYSCPSGFASGTQRDSLALDWNELVKENVDLNQPSILFGVPYSAMGVTDTMGPGEKCMQYYAWFWVKIQVTQSSSHTLGAPLIVSNDGSPAILTAPVQISHIARGDATGLTENGATKFDSTSRDNMICGTYYIECKKKDGKWYISILQINLTFNTSRTIA
jgi:hypothetical protein